MLNLDVNTPTWTKKSVHGGGVPNILKETKSIYNNYYATKEIKVFVKSKTML